MLATPNFINLLAKGNTMEHLEAYLDDRTVVTNRLLIDLLLCLKHRSIGHLASEVSLEHIMRGLQTWAQREEVISDKLEDLVTGLFGEDIRNDLLESRLKELRESTASTQVSWGYK